jgi:multimeric flavodoxin WrbA
LFELPTKELCRKTNLRTGTALRAGGKSMIKAFVINGSPRMEKGNTALILTPFLEGMKDAGANTELVYAKRLKINPCIGDFQCWFEKVGKCIHKDDMQTIYPKLRMANILVLATPVYIPLPGEMQNFINRLCPILEPFLRFTNGRTRGRLHNDVKLTQFVLVSSSGWWELENFSTVIRIVEELALDANIQFGGAVLRPHASELRNYPEKAAAVLTAARQAGYQLVKEGKMDEETLRVISQPLVPEPKLRKQYNEMYLEAREG